MRAGQLRHLLRVQAVESTDDATGTPVPAFEDVGDVYAHVEPLMGRELTEAHAISPRTTHRVTIRPFPGLTSDHRFLFGSRVFDIVAPPRDLDERGRTMVVLCEEAS